MTKRDIIKTVLQGGTPPYVPWGFAFTKEARARLTRHFGTDDLQGALHDHILPLGDPAGFFEELPNARARDVFGVIWDRTMDEDIGVEGMLLGKKSGESAASLARWLEGRAG